VRGGSIFVDGAQRDSLRLTLAAQGLPAAGSAGYELLDQMTGFGTTSQMFDAAYWRAKEGELARTILALPQIKAARVHIARKDPEPFRAPEPQTASVTVTTVSGTLPVAQARALKHLVASAVAGMLPDAVSIIDSNGGLIDTGEGDVDGLQLADRRSAEMKRNVERLLAARVGAGNAIVEVALDVDTDRETISERTFDPEGRVAISTDTTEKSGNSTDPGGDVTVASNLPEGDATPGAAGQSSTSETRERVNFEVSETKRDLARGPGTIRRLNVAVLVNEALVRGEDGSTTTAPRPQEELDVLRDLVAAAVGFDEARGDTLTLRSLSFDKGAEEGTLAESSMLARLDIMSIIQLATLAAVVLILALFVLRPMLLARRDGAESAALDASPLALPGQFPPISGGIGQEGLRVLTGEIDDGSEFSPLPIVAHDAPPSDLPADPVARLRRLIEERQAESLEILRGWMDEREEKV
jgi:flagellar M-ring protein FliF